MDKPPEFPTQNPRLREILGQAERFAHTGYPILITGETGTGKERLAHYLHLHSSRAKDDMMSHTDHKQAPWYVVPSDDKKRARLNCISHLLSLIPYQDLTPKPLKLPRRQRDDSYVRPPENDQTFVPQIY